MKKRLLACVSLLAAGVASVFADDVVYKKVSSMDAFLDEFDNAVANLFYMDEVNRRGFFECSVDELAQLFREDELMLAALMLGANHVVGDGSVNATFAMEPNYNCWQVFERQLEKDDRLYLRYLKSLSKGNLAANADMSAKSLKDCNAMLQKNKDFNAKYFGLITAGFSEEDLKNAVSLLEQN